MAAPGGVWGIELGQCGLKAVRLQMEDGQIVATAFDYVEHPKILSQPDADPDQLTREALEKFLSRNNLRGDSVAISVPGQSGLARFVKLPPVEEKKIGDIVRFEAKQQIPFNLEEVVWDYQKIGSGVVTDGFAMETEIGLFAMKRDMVARYLQHFQDVGVEVHVVQMAPLALCNFVAADLLGQTVGAEAGGDEEKKCVVALDIGTDSSNLVVTDGNRIIWQRPIPLGGNHFTRALTKDLKLTFAKAEHLKRNATKSPDLKKILAALKPVLNDFVGEVQRSLGYFTNTHRDAQIQYMVGLGNAFRLPGLQRFLSEKLQLEVRKLGKMERLSGDAVVTQQVFTENILTFPVAYGLALQGLGQTRLATNLLPPEIRTERLVRAKKPWAVAAAGCLLLGAAALALSYGMELRTYGDSRVEESISQSGGVVKQVAQAQSKFDKTVANAKAQEEAVKSIVAGQMERTHWPELFKFISDAVPRPDGSNLSEDARRLYWTGAPDRTHPDPQNALTGEGAYQEWLKRLRRGPDAEGGEGLGRGIDDLIQINIEGISSAYCDNLGAFWKQVQTDIENEPGRVRPRSDLKKPPQGKGWVVEVRGYTFHYGKDLFVLNTLAENLSRMAGPPKEEDSKTAPGAAPGVPGGPAGAGAKGPAPAGVPGAPGTPAAEEKPKKVDPKDLPDIVGHVSHVVLLKDKFVRGEDTSNFVLINSSLVKDMTRDSAGGMGGMPGMPGAKGGGAGSPTAGMMPGMPGAPSMPGAGGAGGMPAGAGGMPGGAGGTPAPAAEPAAPSGPPRDTWVSLSSLGGGAGGGAPGAMGGVPPVMPGPRGGKPPVGGAFVPPGLGRPGAADAGDARVERGRAVRGRTEFVLMFIWKEETPSDRLRGQTETEGPAPGAASPGMPGMPGGGGMPGMPGMPGGGGTMPVPGGGRK